MSVNTTHWTYRSLWVVKPGFIFVLWISDNIPYVGQSEFDNQTNVCVVLHSHHCIYNSMRSLWAILRQYWILLQSEEPLFKNARRLLMICDISEFLFCEYFGPPKKCNRFNLTFITYPYTCMCSPYLIFPHRVWVGSLWAYFIHFPLLQDTQIHLVE